ncbi:MAG: O-antigen ligase family protein, partial [Anaerolineae bacterium]|nr:O-antigen ligase family protein [Anaerolineae bacterium]
MARRLDIKQGLWILLAIIAGIMIATQPIYIALLAIGFVLLVIASAFTPLTILSVLLILAPLRTLVTTEAVISMPFDIGQLMFVAFVIGWLAWYIIRRKPLLNFQYSKILLPIIVFVIAIGLTAFTAFSLHVWIFEWLKWLIIIVVILLVSRFEDNNAPQWLAFMLIVAAVANAIIGLYIFFGGSGADHLLINGRYFRAFGTFGQPNPFGGFMGLTLPLSIMSVWGYGTRFIRKYHHSGKISYSNLFLCAFFSLTTVILLAGLVTSWSRGAWLAFIASVAAMGFALPHKLWQSIALSSLVALIVVMLWLGGLIPQSIMQRVTSSTEELITIQDVRGVDITSANYAINERLAHWQTAQNMARDYPWLGVGLGNYEIAYEEYRLINWDEALGHAHNYYLNILAE